MAETTKFDLTGVQRHVGKRADCKRPMLKELNSEFKQPVLMDKREIFIGRDEGCEIILDDIKVSRRHAQLLYENLDDRAAAPHVLLKDLGSTNKTYVNGKQIDEAALRDNDTIMIGSTAFGFFLRDESNIRAEQRLVELASNDGLTGLRNRAYFDMAIQRAFTHARALEKGLALVLFDIDHFKKINDTHGHPIGDHVLREIGRIVASCSRSKDLSARYGGEEFGVVLYEAALENAAGHAERLRKAIEAKEFRQGSHELRVTISAGAAGLDPSMEDHAALVQAADKALYRAKQTGRNRVCKADPDERSAARDED